MVSRFLVRGMVSLLVSCLILNPAYAGMYDTYRPALWGTPRTIHSFTAEALSSVALFGRREFLRRSSMSAGIAAIYFGISRIGRAADADYTSERDIKALTSIIAAKRKSALRRLHQEALRHEGQKGPPFLAQLYSQEATLRSLFQFMRAASKEPQAAKSAAYLAGLFPPQPLRRMMEEPMIMLSRLPLNQVRGNSSIDDALNLISRASPAAVTSFSAILNDAVRNQHTRLITLCVLSLDRALWTHPENLSPETGQSLTHVLLESWAFPDPLANYAISALAFAPRVVAESGLVRAEALLELRIQVAFRSEDKSRLRSRLDLLWRTLVKVRATGGARRSPLVRGWYYLYGGWVMAFRGAPARHRNALTPSA